MVEETISRRLIRNLLLAIVLLEIVGEFGSALMTNHAAQIRSLGQSVTLSDLLDAYGFVLPSLLLLGLLLAPWRRRLELSVILFSVGLVAGRYMSWLDYREMLERLLGFSPNWTMLGWSCICDFFKVAVVLAPLGILLAYTRGSPRGHAAGLTRAVVICLGVSAGLAVLVELLRSEVYGIGLLERIDWGLSLAWMIAAFALAPLLFRERRVRPAVLVWLLLINGGTWLASQSLEALRALQCGMLDSRALGYLLVVIASCVPLAQLAVLYAFWRGELRRNPNPHLDGLPVCIGCGYDLTGNVSGRCPECGRATGAAEELVADGAGGGT